MVSVADGILAKDSPPQNKLNNLVIYFMLPVRQMLRDRRTACWLMLNAFQSNPRALTITVTSIVSVALMVILQKSLDSQISAAGDIYSALFSFLVISFKTVIPGLWSRSLLTPVIAHGIENGAGVIIVLARFLQS
jgi:hypothetical protein